MRRWAPWMVPALFALLWYTATQPLPNGEATAPDFILPWAFLAVMSFGWALWVTKRRQP